MLICSLIKYVSDCFLATSPLTKSVQRTTVDESIDRASENIGVVESGSDPSKVHRTIPNPTGGDSVNGSLKPAFGSSCADVIRAVATLRESILIVESFLAFVESFFTLTESFLTFVESVFTMGEYFLAFVVSFFALEESFLTWLESVDALVGLISSSMGIIVFSREEVASVENSSVVYNSLLLHVQHSNSIKHNPADFRNDFSFLLIGVGEAEWV